MDKNQNMPGTESRPQEETANTGSENVQISAPRNDRPEGPFEHSGETAGWTEAEEQEVRQKED